MHRVRNGDPRVRFGSDALEHPENRMVRHYMSSPEGKVKVEAGFAEIIAVLGEVKSATIGKYIQRKDRWPAGRE